MTKNDNRYVALIADAVASRTLAPRARARLQSDVRASLGDLNRRWRRAIAAKFAVTRGDEIEGLLGNAAAVWDIADRKSTRLNSSHRTISYAVFCLKKKK